MINSAGSVYDGTWYIGSRASTFTLRTGSLVGYQRVSEPRAKQVLETQVLETAQEVT